MYVFIDFKSDFAVKEGAISPYTFDHIKDEPAIKEDIHRFVTEMERELEVAK